MFAYDLNALYKVPYYPPQYQFQNTHTGVRGAIQGATLCGCIDGSILLLLLAKPPEGSTGEPAPLAKGTSWR